MRLIDADALYKDICDSINQMTAIGIAVDGEWMWAKLNDALDNAPTIEERKKGKWKRAYLDHEAMGERPSILYCSVCNQCIAYPVNYCPNCGADMRGNDNG